MPKFNPHRLADFVIILREAVATGNDYEIKKALYQMPTQMKAAAKRQLAPDEKAYIKRIEKASPVPADQLQ